MRLRATRTVPRSGRASSGLPAIVRANIVFSQSSVFAGNSVATNASMTNGISDESTQTATNQVNLEPGSWIQMDLQGVFPVTTVTIGTQGTALVGGWGNNATYTNGARLEYSIDGASWTLDRVLSGLTGNSITNISVSFSARFIRVKRLGNWIVLTEFYAS